MRRSWLSVWAGLFGVLILLAGALVGCGSGEKFPSKAISISVISVAGSPNDLIARQHGKLAEKTLNVPVVVENRASGGGMASLSYVQSQPADGYSIASIGQGQASQVTLADSPVGEDDFEALIRESSQPMVTLVRSDSPWKTIEELVAYAKANPKKLRVGGTGLIYQIPTEQLAKLVGMEVSYVTYAGGTEVVPALLGGHVDAANMTPPNALQHIKAGTLKPLAVAFDRRLPYLADVPTLKERGINYIFERWSGLIVKKGTPADRLKTLHDAFKQATASPEWKDFLDKNGESEAYMGPEDFNKLWKTEVATAREYLKSSGRAVK